MSIQHSGSIPTTTKSVEAGGSTSPLFWCPGYRACELHEANSCTDTVWLCESEVFHLTHLNICGAARGNVILLSLPLMTKRCCFTLTQVRVQMLCIFLSFLLRCYTFAQVSARMQVVMNKLLHDCKLLWWLNVNLILPKLIHLFCCYYKALLWTTPEHTVNGKRYRCTSGSSRTLNSFYPQAVRLINSQPNSFPDYLHGVLTLLTHHIRCCYCLLSILLPSHFTPTYSICTYLPQLPRYGYPVYIAKSSLLIVLFFFTFFSAFLGRGSKHLTVSISLLASHC